jgi:hypothetical protein
LELIPPAAGVIGFFSVCGFKRGRDILDKTIDLRIVVSAGEIPLTIDLFAALSTKTTDARSGLIGTRTVAISFVILCPFFIKEQECAPPDERWLQHGIRQVLIPEKPSRRKPRILCAKFFKQFLEFLCFV